MAGTIVWSDTHHNTVGGAGSFTATVLTIPTGLVFAGTPFLIIATAFNFGILAASPLQVYDSNSILINDTSFIANGDLSAGSVQDVSPFNSYAAMKFWRGAVLPGLTIGGRVDMSGFASTGGFLPQAAFDIMTIGVLYDSPSSGAQAVGARNTIVSDPAAAPSGLPLSATQASLGPAVYLGAIGAVSPLSSSAVWANPASADGTWTDITSARSSNLQVTAALFTPTASLTNTLTNSMSGLSLGGLGTAGGLVQSIPYITARGHQFAMIIG